MEVNNKLLPNLLIIGAAKAGTTSLHKYLDQHPQIFMAERKEPRFFLLWNNPERIALHEKEGRAEINYYATPENYQALFKNGADHPVRGESSTAYLANPDCAQKIREIIPGVKIIAVLRNPVERAFSNYVIYKNWRMEKKDFDAAVDEEIKTGRKTYQQPMQYLQLGKYADGLKAYYSLFSKEQIRVYLNEDFKLNTLAVMQDIFEFLGVDKTFTPNLEIKFNNSYIRRYGALPAIDKFLSRVQGRLKKHRVPFLPEAIRKHRFYQLVLKDSTRKKLIEYYSRDIEELEILLGKDLSHWKK
jgi:hypothetical protein